MARVRSVSLKLGNMRKAEEFVVYPASRTVGGEPLTMIQSSHRIATLDPATGKGLLSAYRANGAYFLHLNPMFRPMPITVSAEVLAEILGARPNSGDEIGPGVYVA